MAGGWQSVARNLFWVSPLYSGVEGAKVPADLAPASQFFPSIFIEVLPYRRNIFIQPLDATKRPIQVLLNRKQASVDINVQ